MTPSHATEADPQPEAQPDWWRPLYDELLATMLLERHDPAELDATLGFILAQLGGGPLGPLAPGARIFDQCCGIGSLAQPLAARGYTLVAVDQAQAYIDRARAEADAAGLCIDYHAADAREFVPAQPCVGAFNWWTGFGYGDDDHDNARMLAAAFAAVEPGGVYLLDTMHAAGLLRGFQPQVVTRRAVPEGELVLVRDSAIDLRTGTLAKRWTYFLPDGRRVEHRSRVRLYLPHELVALLEQVGFVDVELFGDLDGSPLTLDTLRCICRAVRPI
jgi:SAM-dependent methyltransferase